MNTKFWGRGMSGEKGEALFDFSQAAMIAEDQNAIWRCLKKTLDGFDVKWITYISGVPGDYVMFSSMASDWLSYYFDHYAETDYLVHYAANSNKVLHVDARYFNGEANLDKTNLEMFDYVSGLGSQGALAIPLPKRGLDAVAGSGVFFGLNAKDANDVVLHHGEEISLIINAAHQFLKNKELQIGTEMFTPRNGEPLKKSAILTQREKDVLQYLTEGLRPERIAERMGLQPATVHLHIRKARKRLGASTREQAIAVAIRKRLILL